MGTCSSSSSDASKKESKTSKNKVKSSEEEGQYLGSFDWRKDVKETRVDASANPKSNGETID